MLNTKRQTTTLAAIAIMGAGSLALATPALAASPDDIVQITISANDLTNAQGVMSVYEAFQEKAESACEQNGLRGLEARKLEKICEVDLVDDFVVDLNDPNVFEVHYNGTVTVE